MISNKLTLGYIFAAILEFCLIFMWVQHAREPYANQDIEIYVVYHKPNKLYRSDILIPIQAGRALHPNENEKFFSQMIGDDTGDNISLKNDRYSELTALYWIWKNSKARYIGLMHYRRFFNLYNSKTVETFDDFGLTRGNIEAIMMDADVVTAHYSGFNTGSNIYEHYLRNHYGEDFYVVIRKIMKKYPELTDKLYRFLAKDSYIPFNMFIARKKVIDAYCEWLFDILFSVEEDLDFPHGQYDSTWKKSEMSFKYQRRAPSFIAERLFTFWLEVHKDRYRYKEFPCIYFEQEWDENEGK